jgi:uncharacterized protein involved in type VI secretion and phage assembly
LFTDCGLDDFYRAEAWIEFERGDPDSPVWTGCLWARDE